MTLCSRRLRQALVKKLANGRLRQRYAPVLNRTLGNDQRRTGRCSGRAPSVATMVGQSPQQHRDLPRFIDAVETEFLDGTIRCFLNRITRGALAARY